MLLSRYNHLLVGRACCFWAMPRSGTSSTSWSNSVELQSPMNGMWKIWALSRLMFKIWFDLWQGGADKDTSPNASIAGESAALPSFQSVARQAWPSTLPTPASVGCQLIWISRPFQNQKQNFNVLPNVGGHEIHLRLHCILSSPISEHSTVPPRTWGTESLDRKVDKNETRVKTVFVFNPFHLQVCLQGNRSRDQRASQPDLSLSHLIFGFL